MGRPPHTAIERAAAAVLACGPGAALSHRSALALWVPHRSMAVGFERALARALNDGRHAKLVRLADLADAIERFPHHPGAGRLRPFVEAPGGPTRSSWEDEFPALCRPFGLPEPVMAGKVAGYEVDALFPREKVIIELDS